MRILALWKSILCKHNLSYWAEHLFPTFWLPAAPRQSQNHTDRRYEVASVHNHLNRKKCLLIFRTKANILRSKPSWKSPFFVNRFILSDCNNKSIACTPNGHSPQFEFKEPHDVTRETLKLSSSEPTVWNHLYYNGTALIHRDSRSYLYVLSSTWQKLLRTASIICIFCFARSKIVVASAW